MKVDSEAAKQHLTAARDALSQLTQLPAAAQLQGEPRTQVSQLIMNFNELITTKENWKASYDKLDANLKMLLGPDAPEAAAPPAAGVPGAVGTSGTTAIDPAIRAKLVEFRTHLNQFEKAAEVARTRPARQPPSPAQRRHQPLRPAHRRPRPAHRRRLQLHRRRSRARQRLSAPRPLDRRARRATSTPSKPS